MNLPNKLTLCRIILVPVFMIFVSLTEFGTETFNATWYLVAGIVFAAASFTDYLDGHLARKWHMVTDFGKFSDPLADKLLTTVALIYMMRDGVCSPVVLCIILAREFAVSGLRMVAAGAKDGKVIAANMWGKVKTVLQMLTIIFYYFGNEIFCFGVRITADFYITESMINKTRCPGSIFCFASADNIYICRTGIPEVSCIKFAIVLQTFCKTETDAIASLSFYPETYPACHILTDIQDIFVTKLFNRNGLQGFCNFHARHHLCTQCS